VKRESKSSPSPFELLLEGVPLCNRQARLERQGESAVLRVPLRRKWWMRPPFNWLFPFRDERGFGLDRYGLEVWEACDGRRDVESICEDFAARHTVGFGEARAVVGRFLRALTERELIVIRIPGGEEAQ